MTTRPSPAELATMSSRDLVLRAAADHPVFGQIGEILQGRAPDEDAARSLVEVYEAGRAPAWLTAYLLGCLRVRATYALVRGILESAPGLSAESYAGVAMACLAGAWPRAPDEVERTAAIDAVFHLSARLGGLRDASLARAAREAMRAGTVRIAPRTRAMLEERIATLLDRP